MAATIEPVAADEHNSGPDQIFEASSYVTSDIDGAVKLRIDLDDEGENEYLPISLPSMLLDAAEKSPSQFALGVKRDEKWVKWTYSDYLKGNKIAGFALQN